MSKNVEPVIKGLIEKENLLLALGNEGSKYSDMNSLKCYKVR